MVGAFHQPRLVYMNLSVLRSLPDVEFACGMGEVIKSALIQTGNSMTGFRKMQTPLRGKSWIFWRRWFIAAVTSNGDCGTGSNGKGRAGSFKSGPYHRACYRKTDEFPASSRTVRGTGASCSRRDFQKTGASYSSGRGRD